MGLLLLGYSSASVVEVHYHYYYTILNHLPQDTTKSKEKGRKKSSLNTRLKKVERKESVELRLIESQSRG